jgi:tetratricopeptide (TPR) repeat protein
MNAYSHAINIYHHYPSMDCSALYANIANIYSKCRMLANAESYYLKAIAERKQKKPTQKDLLFHVYRKLSETQMQMKKYKEAEDSLNRAQKLAEHGHGELVEILKESAILRETQNKWE